MSEILYSTFGMCSCVVSAQTPGPCTLYFGDSGKCHLLDLLCNLMQQEPGSRNCWSDNEIQSDNRRKNMLWIMLATIKAFASPSDSPAANADIASTHSSWQTVQGDHPWLVVWDQKQSEEPHDWWSNVYWGSISSKTDFFSQMTKYGGKW